MSLEDYIKDLAPELQEKARACGNVEELLALAKDANVPLPDEALAAIAGGDQPDVGNCKKLACPKCGSTNVVECGEEGADEGVSILGDLYRCKDCGCIFIY